MYFDKTFFDIEGSPNEVNLICNKCGDIIQVTDMTIFTKVQSDYCIIAETEKVKCDCGNTSQHGLVEPKKLVSLEKATVKQTIQLTNTPKCPTCSSTNIKPISGTERVTSVIGLGVFSKKINKTFKCLNCKHTW